MMRRLRGRFGILAPRVTVRAHIPLHWRVLAIILLLTAAIIMASSVYLIGSRYAGYDRITAKQELSSLRNRVEVLETEAERLRAIGNSSEASLQVERTTQQKLSEQVKRLEVENGHLREDMAAFENLASGETKNGAISIHRMQVEPDPIVVGAYQYRFLLVAPVSRSEREFKGWLQLVATAQQDGKTVIVNIPDAAAPDSQKLQVGFRYFRRIEGSFPLPVKAVLKKLEVRLMQGAVVVTTQQLTM